MSALPSGAHAVGPNAEAAAGAGKKAATLGVVGGGQLGRMFVHAAQRLGFRAVVLDPDVDSPAGRASDDHLWAAYDDASALECMASMCGAVTTEFENVPAGTLATLARSLPVAPGADAVAVAQDRVREKAHFAACGVACAPHAVVDSDAALAAVPGALLPGILKTAHLGYDGKGQARVADRAQLAAAWQQLGRVPCVLEQLLPLAGECSVLLARGADGAVVFLPVQKNLHRGGILAVTEVYEGNVPETLAGRAQAASKKIADGLGYVGVLCVEFFVLADGSLVANEIAPRPHNSGHWSIDAADHSQFDLQVRALAGLPLPAPRQHSAAVMLNLLGDLWFDAATAAPRAPDWRAVLALPGVHLHLYGKRDARPGRKMGHLTATAERAQDAVDLARRCAALLGIEAW